MQHQENNKPPLTRQSQSENEERKQLHKMQMVLNAMEKIRPKQQPRMENWIIMDD